MRHNFEDDIEEFISEMNSFRDVIFAWKGVAYFIDCCTMKKTSKYYTNRRISVFDLEVRSPIVSTSCLYGLDINDMLDNHYIDGERLRDIIMDAECLDVY